MKTTNLMLAFAIGITASEFKNRLDKGGKPYITHCLRVMDAMPDDDELKCIAVMHDLVEDSETSLSQLSLMGFSQRVVDALRLLTHDPKVPYDDYIKLISTNPDAVRVKLADLRDNSDITRLKGLTKKDFDRLEKYHRSYVYLSKL